MCVCVRVCTSTVGTIEQPKGKSFRWIKNRQYLVLHTNWALSLSISLYLSCLPNCECVRIFFFSSLVAMFYLSLIPFSHGYLGLNNSQREMLSFSLCFTSFSHSTLSLPLIHMERGNALTMCMHTKWFRHKNAFSIVEAICCTLLVDLIASTQFAYMLCDVPIQMWVWCFEQDSVKFCNVNERRREREREKSEMNNIVKL